MANRPQPISALAGIGAAVAALVLAAMLVPLGTVFLHAEGASSLRAADWAAVRFTLLQALLSALVSVLLAIPVARALARRSFKGRRAVITLMGAPFVLPVIVAVMGLLAVFGRNGWVSQGLEIFGLPQIEIYGLHGVVLAHVFFNLPLAVRLVLHGWLAIPSERFRLARSLGFSASDMQRHFEWPMLRAALPGAFLVIFLLCTTSFAVALILGGGPRATTVELAIYQAFRFEFDLTRAALLAVVQVCICAGAGLFLLWRAAPQRLGAGLDRPLEFKAPQGAVLRVQDTLAIGAAGLFLVMPLAALVLGGIGDVLSLPQSVWQAAIRSVIMAVLSAGLAVGFALPMAALMARQGWRLGVDVVGALSIAVSPLVIGTGVFLLVFPFINPTQLALPVTVFVNALMSLPFLLRAVAPAYLQAERAQGRLADTLGLRGWNRLRHAILPRLMRPLGFGAGLAAALSMGDLGVIALFSSPSQSTLPLEMYRLMGSYRTNDAQGAAVLLLFLSLGLFWLFDRGGRVNAKA